MTTGDNYIENLNLIGDAIAEVSSNGSGNTSWNSDYAEFVNANVPFFTRGGGWYSGASAGIYTFYHNPGYCYNDVGFRAVLISL